MTTIKTKTAEVLFPLLSAFHDVNGLRLKAVSQRKMEDSLVGIAFDFGSKALIVKADGEDDTVEFWSAESALLELFPEDISNVYPWIGFIGQEFGWGWSTVNQQGYLDGIILSFGGIMPQLLLTVVASSLKVCRIAVPIRTVAEQ
jgi:hypothetical protein